VRQPRVTPCTREITGWSLGVRCRAAEAIAVVDEAAAARAIRPGELTLGTDNGTALTARAFRARLTQHRIVHRRGGYRDPESQAFIESWHAGFMQQASVSAPISGPQFAARDHGHRHANEQRSGI
jgi:putative transposase